MRFIVPASGGRDELVIEAIAAENINYFLNTPLTPVTSSSATVAASTVKQHSRRQFPGDSNASTVSSHGRQFLRDSGRKVGNALGGNTITLVGDMGLPGEERRDFTLVRGRIMDLHAFLVGEAKMQVHLYGPTGARYTIDAATP